MEHSQSKSEEKKRPPNGRRRMTKYIQIKDYIKNDDLKDYKEFVDKHETKI